MGRVLRRAQGDVEGRRSAVEGGSRYRVKEFSARLKIGLLSTPQLSTSFGFRPSTVNARPRLVGLRRGLARAYQSKRALHAALRCSPVLLSAILHATSPGVPAKPTPVPAAIQELRARVPRATVGFLAVDAETGQELAAFNADLPMIPASNQKLLTTSAALSELGADHRLLTEVRLEARTGTTASDLVVVGSGDPTIDGWIGPCTEAFFSAIVDACRRAGATEITGDVVCDESRLGDDHYAPDWQLRDLQQPYAAPLSAICFDDNARSFFLQCAPRQKPLVWSWWPDPVGAELRPSNHTQIQYDWKLPDSPLTLRGWVEVGRVEPRTVPVVEPALFWARRIREYLVANGIVVRGEARANRRDDPLRSAGPCRTLLLWPSPPLRDIVRETNKRSLNLWADLLCKVLGLEIMGDGSLAAGTEAVRFFAQGAGADDEEMDIFDGSGLSRTDLVTPRALVTLLLEMRHSPAHDAFLDSLPVAGVDGTLKSRFENSWLEGRMMAKTGLLLGVGSLSGYLQLPREIAFSLILNGRGASSRTATLAMDRAVLRLAEAFRHPSKSR